MQTDAVVRVEPWWRFGHVWLVISGPALVIVACIVTAYFIATSPNEIVNDANYQQIIAQKKAQGEKMMGGSNSPALQARNHAATGVVPLSK
jgi:hypothetical protein